MQDLHVREVDELVAAADLRAQVEVLAADRHGHAATWVKSFGGPPGTGFVRLWGRPKMPDPALVRGHGRLGGVSLSRAGFDGEGFGVPDAERATMDPQRRPVLEQGERALDGADWPQDDPAVPPQHIFDLHGQQAVVLDDENATTGQVNAIAHLDSFGPSPGVRSPGS